MTIEEAIDQLQDLRKDRESFIESPDPEDVYIRDIEAISVAIAALREEPEMPLFLSALLAPMDSYKGLKRKFIVFKSDTGEMVEDCFVLRPDKDPAAVAALRAYAEATDNKTLAADIIDWVGSDRNDPLTLEELRQMDVEPVWITSKNMGSGWCIVLWHGVNKSFLYFIKTGTAEGQTEVPVSANKYGELWLAYRSKPKEG